MTDQELLKLLDRLKATMIAVATGGPRIGDVQVDFASGYDEVALELANRQMQNPLPYRDLWEWYGRWSSGDMPSWQLRRNFVNNIFGNLVRSIPDKPVQQSSFESTTNLLNSVPSSMSPVHERRFDCFVSYASEDRQMVKLLVEALAAQGIEVWWDKGQITLGDRLTVKIDEGLSRSRYGLFIISPSFVAKRWPETELRALSSRAIGSGRKVILPVLVDMNHDEFASTYPLLSDIVSTTFDGDMVALVDEITRAVE
jgi:hypothetical protein